LNVIESDWVIDFIFGHIHLGPFSLWNFNNNFVCFVDIFEIDVMPERNDLISIRNINPMLETLFLIWVGFERGGKLDLLLDIEEMDTFSANFLKNAHFSIIALRKN
jgi:hypothetical protein